MRAAQRRSSSRGGTGALDSLAQWARTDPRVSPLVPLQVVALRAGDDEGWIPDWRSCAAPAPDGENSAVPLLHDCSLAVDGERLRALLLRMVEACPPQTARQVEPLRRALKTGMLDVRALLESEINRDADGVARIQRAVSVDPALLDTLTQLAARPFLTAYTRQAEKRLGQWDWDAGYCPVCAAYPLLAEIRGLEQQRWLRCGRCTAGWRFELQRCVYCGNRDFRTLGYLAAVETHGARQAATCDRCHGYLKGVATHAALSPAELVLEDLKTLELDVAALERGYARPQPAFPLRVHLTERQAQEARTA